MIVSVAHRVLTGFVLLLMVVDTSRGNQLISSYILLGGWQHE